MKKFAVTVLILAVFALLWMQVRSSARIQMSFLTGELATLERGDLTIPIEATGTIEPKDRIEIKSEASGRVSETPLEVGDMVQAGDVIVKLDPEDEQRLVNKAEKAVEQTRINLERAKWTLEQRKQDIPATEARITQNAADLEYWTWKHDHYLELEGGTTSNDEIRLYKANKAKFEGLAVQLQSQFQQTLQMVELGKLDVKQAELSLQQASHDLDDASERLRETTIRAPENGMLVRLHVKRGSVIASGSMSLTGGTPLAYMADVNTMYVRALVDEADIGRVYDIAPAEARPGRSAAEQAGRRLAITEGTPVEVTVEAFPEETFKGYIELIEPEPAHSPGDVVVSYAVRIRLESPEVGKLQLGMQANVRFVSESVEDVVLVPNEAVRIVAGQRGVYLAVNSQKEPGKKVPKFANFRAGLDDGMYTQVIDGLEEGTQIYVQLPRNSRGEQITRDE